jgi:hypothetical protein
MAQEARYSRRLWLDATIFDEDKFNVRKSLTTMQAQQRPRLWLDVADSDEDNHSACTILKDAGPSATHEALALRQKELARLARARSQAYAEAEIRHAYSMESGSPLERSRWRASDNSTTTLQGDYYAKEHDPVYWTPERSAQSNTDAQWQPSIAKPTVSRRARAIRRWKSGKIPAATIVRRPTTSNDECSDPWLDSFPLPQKDRRPSRAEHVAALKGRDMIDEISAQKTARPPSPVIRKQCMSWIFESLNLAANHSLLTASGPKPHPDVCGHAERISAKYSIRAPISKCGQESPSARPEKKTARGRARDKTTSSQQMPPLATPTKKNR